MYELIIVNRFHYSMKEYVSRDYKTKVCFVRSLITYRMNILFAINNYSSCLGLFSRAPYSSRDNY
jgi:hypothetical protein